MKISGLEKMKNNSVAASNKFRAAEDRDVGFPVYIAWYVAGLAMVILSVATY